MPSRPTADGKMSRCRRWSRCHKQVMWCPLSISLDDQAVVMLYILPFTDFDNTNWPAVPSATWIALPVKFVRAPSVPIGSLPTVVHTVLPSNDVRLACFNAPLSSHATSTSNVPLARRPVTLPPRFCAYCFGKAGRRRIRLVLSPG